MKFIEHTVSNDLISMVQSSWRDTLLIFILLGWASHFVWNPTTTFIFNFVGQKKKKKKIR